MNKNAKKMGAMTALIYVIIFAVFNLLVFFIFKEKTGVFWMSYAFVCIAFGVQIISMLLSFKGADTETVFMGIPLASLSLYYFFAAAFAGIVFMAFRNAPFKLALAIQVIILAVYLVVAILSLMARDTVQQINDEVKESVREVKRLHVEVDSLLPLVTDPALKKAIRRVSETVKYSDPISTEAVADLDEQIREAINGLRIYVENGSGAEAAQSCREIEMLYMQRNSLLKASK